MRNLIARTGRRVDQAMVEQLKKRNDAPRSKLRGITEHSFGNFSDTELNPVASYGEYPSSIAREVERARV